MSSTTLTTGTAVEMDLAGLYASRQQRFAGEERHFERLYNRVSLLRFLVFVGALGGCISLIDVHNLAALGVLAAGIAAFAVLVVRHERILQQREHRRRLRRVNERELERLEQRLDGLETGGARLQAEHPYTADLDIFGPGSLYQFLCRAHTGLGKDTLADWLSGPAEPNEIRRRQAAVDELAGLLDWRQGFEAQGLRAEEAGAEPGAFLDWLAEPAVVSGRPVLARIVRFAPWATAGALLLGGTLGLPPLSALGMLLVLGQIGLNFAFEEQVRRCHASTSRQSKLFRAYVELLAAIESQDFRTDPLTALRGRLVSAALPASGWIRRLAEVVRHLDLRYGMMHFPVNSVLLWDLRWMLHLEEWKRAVGDRIGGWFDAIAQIEALCSLAGLRHDHPGWAMPQIVEGAPSFEAEAMGHPLIPEQRSVRNDFEILGPGQVAIVSGSNMAGKSTFLRALGANAVLALAGGPVCAKRLRIAPLQVYTSMRTQDSLGESTSLFYAELKRLKRTIDAVARKEPVLFLLDEILKGTNSKDRHTGSEALLRQLHRGGGTGLIATHDLELARLEEQMAGAVRNFSFESEAQDGRLLFDYKLRRGACTSMNAVTLMRSMGIEIQE